MKFHEIAGFIVSELRKPTRRAKEPPP